MKNIKLSVATLIVIIALLFPLLTPKSFAQTCTSRDDCQNKIKEYEQKLSETREKKDTLSSQVQFMDTQIYLTQLRIQETERQVQITQNEIDSLAGRIGGLNRSLDFLTKVLLNKITEGYKRRQDIGFLNILLESDNASTVANKLKYTQITQENDSRLTFQVQQAKQKAEEEKDLRERKKEELASLEAQLEGQKVNLDKQRTEKQSLLRITQNDEVRYQVLLRQAIAESNAIQQAIVTGQQIGPVKAGDPIALMGNSGAPNCSTGTHLHFEVHQNDSYVDPNPYLAKWQQPLQPPIEITQGYGQTPWSSRYPNGIHTGIDMYTPSSDVIRAPADGTLYSATYNCGGPIINVKYIDHGDGIKSFYLHVQ